MGGASSGLDLGGALSDNGTALHKMALVNQRMIFQAVETFLQNCSVYFPVSGVVCLFQGSDTSLVRRAYAESWVIGWGYKENIGWLCFSLSG